MAEWSVLLLFGAASVGFGAWALWASFRLLLDWPVVAAAVVRAVRLSLAWPRTDATVTATHPGADVASGAISIAFDLPEGGTATTTLPKFAPSLRARRSVKLDFLALAGDRAVGSKVAIVFDPADPRRAEHHVGVAMGAATLVAETALVLSPLLPAGSVAVAAFRASVVS